MKRILVLEPYFGGSHKLFLNGLQETVGADYTLLTLPARRWKMRMQLSALWFVEQVRLIPQEERFFDTVLCSTFVDVAVLRSLLLTLPGWNHQAWFCTYFHENQFAYPNQVTDASVQHFNSINFTTALSSDRCAFNSHFNLESFLDGIRSYLKKATDMKLSDCVSTIREKSIVLYPGMDYSCVDNIQGQNKQDGPPVIVWNHRWEHDKGPELFFEALYRLQEKGVAFQVMVLGQSFANVPECFEEARKRLTREIVHFGYVRSKKQYGKLLKQADIVVSTAIHEFFGIAVLEAVRAGCYPLLPKDLSYPELYDDQYLYKTGKLASRLERMLGQSHHLEEDKAYALTQRFSWNECKKQYQQWLF